MLYQPVLWPREMRPGEARSFPSMKEALVMEERHSAQHRSEVMVG